MNRCMYRIDLYGGDDIESSLFEAKTKPTSPRKQVYSYWPLYHSFLARLDLLGHQTPCHVEKTPTPKLPMPFIEELNHFLECSLWFSQLTLPYNEKTPTSLT